MHLAVHFEDRVVHKVTALVIFGQDRHIIVAVNLGVDLWEPIVGCTVVHRLDPFAVTRVVGVDVLTAVDAFDGADVFTTMPAFQPAVVITL